MGLEFRRPRCKWNVRISNYYYYLFALAHAQSRLDAAGMPFADLFWCIWKALKLSLPTKKEYCYMFEMLSVDNIIVTKCAPSLPLQCQPLKFRIIRCRRVKEDAVVLHGVRDMRSLKEVTPGPFGNLVTMSSGGSCPHFSSTVGQWSGRCRCERWTRLSWPARSSTPPSMVRYTF